MRWPKAHRHPVEYRLADDRLHDRVVDPVVDRHARMAAGHLLPRSAVRVAPTVREADHTGAHVVGDRDPHLAAMDAGFEDRHLAVTALVAGGLVRVHVEQPTI